MSEEFKIKIASDFDARGAEQASDAMDAMAETSLPKIESPAKKAEQALHEVEKQAIDAATALRTPAAAADAMDEEIDQLTQRLIEAKIGTADFTAAQNDLAAALQRQFEATQKVTPALEQKNAASKQVESTSRNTGMAMLEFSRAFEDAQYGIAGVLNNIPGLLGALGLGAGLAGVASVAAVVLAKTLGPAFDALDEKLDLSGEASDKRKEKAAELNEELAKAIKVASEAQFDKVVGEIGKVSEAQQTINERIQGEIELQGELRRAREETYQSQLKLQESTTRVEVATGVISEEEGAAKMAALRAEMNEANLAASKAAIEQTRINQQAIVNGAKEMAEAARQEKAMIEGLVAREIEKLEDLKRQRADALRVQKEEKERVFNEASSDGKVPEPNNPIAKAIFDPSVLSPLFEALSRKINGLEPTYQADQAVAANKAEIDAATSNINKGIAKAGSQVEKIEEADKKLLTETEKLTRVNAAVDAKIETLEQVATNKEIIEKAEGLKDKLEKNAEESAKAIEKAIEGVEPQNAKEKAALGELKKALEDGKVFPNEVQKVTQALNDLYGQLNGNFQQIVQQLQVNAQTQSGILRSLQTLQSQALSDREKVNGLLRSQSR